MNKKLRMATVMVVFLLPLLIVAGCKKETGLPKETQELLWRGKRTKPFGVFEYSDLSKETTESILKEKFAVSLSVLPAKAERILDHKFLVDSNEKGVVTYTIEAKENKLFVRGFYPYEHTGTLAVFAYIDSEYHYIPESEQVVLVDQMISLSNRGEVSAFQPKNIEALLQKLGELVRVENLTVALTKFKEHGKGIKSEELEVSDNGKDAYKKKKIHSSLYVGVNEKSEIKEIYARLTDYRE